MAVTCMDTCFYLIYRQELEITSAHVTLSQCSLEKGDLHISTLLKYIDISSKLTLNYMVFI